MDFPVEPIEIEQFYHYVQIMIHNMYLCVYYTTKYIEWIKQINKLLKNVAHLKLLK